MELTKNEMKNAQENAYMYLVDKNQMIVTNLSTEFDDDEGYLAIIKYNRKKRKYDRKLEKYWNRQLKKLKRKYKKHN